LPFRFIHTADVHLDSPLLSLALRDHEIATLIGGATRQSFQKTIQLCLDEAVNALLIAGDLYDGTMESMKTALFFSQQMKRLQEAGIWVFMILGNHDMKAKVTQQLRLMLPDNVRILRGRDTTQEVIGTNVTVHGVSFSKEQELENLLPKYRPPVAGRINIGLLHTSLNGAAGHDPYAPCSLTELAGHGFQYWALGHIHKRSVNTQDGCTVVMPGIPQGRHINESGARSVTLGTVHDDGRITVEERHTHQAQFERVGVNAAPCEDWRTLLRTVETTLETAQAANKAPHFIARLEITGSTFLASQLYHDADLLLQETRQMGGNQVFVEKIALAVQRLRLETKSLTQAAALNPVAELAELMEAALAGNTAFQEMARRDLEEMRRFLPDTEWRSWFGNREEEQEEKIETLIAAGRDKVLAALERNSAEGE
jgi:DNA repair exonuclease SbcCD nuclease subunit